MIRVAAVGDVHYGPDCPGRLGPHLPGIDQRADLLLLAGDLTCYGTPEEVAELADDLAEVSIPVVGVLGNHDYHSDQQMGVRKVLEDVGVVVLEGEHATFQIGDERVGVAGTKGFGGGFLGACGSDFGEPEMKAFVEYSRLLADGLESALGQLDADYRIALLHFSPSAETLVGERLEIYPFLGSYLLAEAVERGGADIAFHGHAHVGTEQGTTTGGVPVRNVAMQVLRRPFAVYRLESGEDGVRVAEVRA